MSQNEKPDARPERPATSRSDNRDSREKDPREDIIGQKLRGLYDEVASQPVPDRFVELLDKLAKAEGKAEGKRK